MVDDQQVAFHAFEIWESEHNPVGKQDEHWFRAKRDLKYPGLPVEIKAHQSWLNSNGDNAARRPFYEYQYLAKCDLRRANLRQADLSGRKLEGTDLEDAQLERANLKTANLRNANLRNCNLSDADLDGAHLDNAQLDGANMIGAKLTGACLRQCDLTLVKIEEHQLAGADLSGCKLPSSFSFNLLTRANDLAKENAKYQIIILSACLYSLFTLCTTSDPVLISSSTPAELPIVNLQIPIQTFYIIAPLIILPLFLNFLLCSQELWETMAELPAIFPDSRSIEKRIFPWIPTSIAYFELSCLETGESRFFPYLKWFSSVLITWGIVPFTMFWFWYAYLPRHESLGSALQCVCVGATLCWSIGSYACAIDTLHNANRSHSWTTGFWVTLGVALIVGAGIGYALWDFSKCVFTTMTKDALQPRETVLSWLFCALITVSLIPFLRRQYMHRTVWMMFSFLVACIIGTTRICNQYVFDEPHEEPTTKAHGFFNDWRLFRDTFLNVNANLSGAEISKKSANWTAAANQSEVVTAANLKYRNLRFASADNVFLEESNLDRTDWSYAHLRKAELSHSSMIDSDLVQTDLSGAILKKTDLRGADLTNAILTGADITGAHFEDSEEDQDGNLPHRQTKISLEQLKLAKNYWLATYSESIKHSIDRTRKGTPDNATK